VAKNNNSTTIVNSGTGWTLKELATRFDMLVTEVLHGKSGVGPSLGPTTVSQIYA